MRVVDNIDYNELKTLIKVHTTRGQAQAIPIPGQEDTALAKFEQVCEPACEVAKADGVLIVGLLCPQFLRSAKAQMRSARTP